MHQLHLLYYQTKITSTAPTPLHQLRLMEVEIVIEPTSRVSHLSSKNLICPVFEQKNVRTHCVIIQNGADLVQTPTTLKKIEILHACKSTGIPCSPHATQD